MLPYSDQRRKIRRRDSCRSGIETRFQVTKAELLKYLSGISTTIWPKIFYGTAKTGIGKIQKNEIDTNNKNE